MDPSWPFKWFVELLKPYIQFHYKGSWTIAMASLLRGECYYVRNATLLHPVQRIVKNISSVSASALSPYPATGAPPVTSSPSQSLAITATGAFTSGALSTTSQELSKTTAPYSAPITEDTHVQNAP